MKIMKFKSEKKTKAMKNLNKILLAILLLIFVLKGFAQQDPMYTIYNNNPVLVNPAYAGTEKFPSLNGVFRKQWVGIEGSPTTSSLSYLFPVKKYNFGIGTTLIYDALGPTTQTGLYLDYAYHIRLKGEKVLSLGLKGGFNYFYINYKGLTYNEPDDDLNLLENESIFLPNFGVGAYYYSDKFYLGLSVPKLIRNSYVKKENTFDHLNREEWHVFLTGGYDFKLSENINLMPSFITRYAVGSPLSIELQATFVLYDKVWLGAMYRVGDSFGGLIRWQVSDRFHIGYSYDLTHSNLGAFNKGSHEIIIGYSFINKEQRILSPRHF
jgi:type IX secretion system PorP/SprF family membrane protein